jgi:hypothetical protein
MISLCRFSSDTMAETMIAILAAQMATHTFQIVIERELKWFKQESTCGYCTNSFLRSEGCSCSKCGAEWCLSCYTSGIHEFHEKCQRPPPTFGELSETAEMAQELKEARDFYDNLTREINLYHS